MYTYTRRRNGVSEIQLTVFFFLPSYPYPARKSNYLWEVDVKSSDMRNREATLNEYDNFRIILTDLLMMEQLCNY